MKNMFKLAAVAVSMALAASLVACSSGDDVVDASTPKYLLAEQIDKYVASVKYDQDVQKDDIEKLGEAHDAMMGVIGGCEECCKAYFEDLLKSTEFDVKDKERKTLSPNDVADITNKLKSLVTKTAYDTEEKFHKNYVYAKAVRDAIDVVNDNQNSSIRKNFGEIGKSKGGEIKDGKLNDNQAASMNAYLDAVKALKDVLDLKDADLKKDDASKTLVTICEEAIKKADKAITDFEKKVEEAKVKPDDTTTVTDAVNSMCTAIDNVLKKYDLMDVASTSGSEETEED